MTVTQAQRPLQLRQKMSLIMSQYRAPAKQEQPIEKTIEMFCKTARLHLLPHEIILCNTYLAEYSQFVNAYEKCLDGLRMYQIRGNMIVSVSKREAHRRTEYK